MIPPYTYFWLKLRARARFCKSTTPSRLRSMPRARTLMPVFVWLIPLRINNTIVRPFLRACLCIEIKFSCPGFTTLKYWRRHLFHYFEDWIKCVSIWQMANEYMVVFMDRCMVCSYKVSHWSMLGFDGCGPSHLIMVVWFAMWAGTLPWNLAQMCSQTPTHMIPARLIMQKVHHVIRTCHIADSYLHPSAKCTFNLMFKPLDV